jgi:hypothetical protein
MMGEAEHEKSAVNEASFQNFIEKRKQKRLVARRNKYVKMLK